MSSKAIRIYCEDTAAPLETWIIEVEFRAACECCEVWAHKDIDDKNPQWKKIGEIADCNWRSICTFLLNNKTVRLFGDFWISVDVTGLPTILEEDLVTAAFVVDDDVIPNYTLILRLILGFTDTEVLEVNKQLPTLIVREDQVATTIHQSLETIAKKSNELGLIGQSLASIKERIGLTTDATLKEVADHIVVIECK